MYDCYFLLVSDYERYTQIIHDALMHAVEGPCDAVPKGTEPSHHADPNPTTIQRRYHNPLQKTPEN
jgi:hypothetical protein